MYHAPEDPNERRAEAEKDKIIYTEYESHDHNID
jgi:hypothetical protein